MTFPQKEKRHHAESSVLVFCMMLSEYLEVPGKIHKSKNILDAFCSTAQCLDLEEKLKGLYWACLG